MKTLAEIVRTRRLELGMSQRELAITLGCTEGRIRRIENGRTHDPRRRDELADALKLPRSVLYDCERSPDVA